MQVNCKEFARFYKRMLTINQKQRITPHEALEHPFFTPSETLKASALGEQTREKHRACRLRKKKKKSRRKRERRPGRECRPEGFSRQKRRSRYVIHCVRNCVIDAAYSS
jgi:serine/threonine protein kinase